MDDLDTPRIKSGSVAQILDDLAWLGLDWDQATYETGTSYKPGTEPSTVITQSKRINLYQRAFEQLAARSRVFACYCSRKDIQQAVSAPHGRSPVYPGTCRDNIIQTTLHTDLKAQRQPAWRVRVDEQQILFDDVVVGQVEQNLVRDCGDFVIKRNDGLFAYHLANVVDDGELKITDVVRGHDLIDSTPRQIFLARLLGYEVPRYWHVALMTNAHGRRLAKRDGSDSLEQLRATGVTSSQVVGLLAHSAGLIDQAEPLTAQDLLALLSIDTLHRKIALA